MEALDSLLVALDPVLVAPYRLVNDPAGAFWLGTLVLAGWCLLLGETTLALARRLNREPLERHAREAKDYQARSLRALKAGDKTAYRAINRLASDAFGHSFFLGAALGMGALWPLFFAAAWLKLRFGALGAPLPGLDLALPWPAALAACYLALRLAWGRIKKHRAAGSAPATGPRGPASDIFR